MTLTLPALRLAACFCASLLILLGACQSGSPKPEAPAAEPATASKPKAKKATIADVEAGIRAHISQKTAEGDGYFDFIADSTQYRFRLVRVHTQYLSVLKRGSYFACVDLADELGDVYDVDFFLEGEPGNMHVTRTKVHKLNGKPRYTWKQNKEDKTWFTVPTAEADNELLGVIEGEDAFEFRYATKIPEMTEAGKLWLPMATSDDFQQIEVRSIDSPVKHQLLEDQQFGNSVLYLEVAPEHSGKELVVTYAVDRNEKGPYSAPDSDVDQVLASSDMLPIGGRFAEIVEEVMAKNKPQTDLMKARALYDYIIDNMRYAKQGTYGTGDANFACDSKSGNCTEFHSFFISLARTAGIPARSDGIAAPMPKRAGMPAGRASEMKKE